MTEEVNWERLDKQKFLVYGAGLFSGLTTVLFPLTVIKTRQQALEGAPSGLRGAAHIARQVVRHDGFRGLYRGFGTVVIGVIPARGVYLTTLEMTKSWSAESAASLAPTPSAASALSNFVGGAFASLVTQSVVVPVDVVSQRLMVAGSSGSYGLDTEKGAASVRHSPRGRQNGFQLGTQILRNEGIKGLYRGFGASIATFVPSSAIWWSAYGGYQRAIWYQLDKWRGADPENPPKHEEREVAAVQAAAALLGGCTSATLTNPLDVIKTRLQVAERALGTSAPSFFEIGRRLVREQGMLGLWRGVAPRVVNVALWGTAMVSTYEFLKRICALPEPTDSEHNRHELTLL